MMASNSLLTSESDFTFSGIFVYAISLLSNIFKVCAFLVVYLPFFFPLVVAIKVLACCDLLHPTQKQTYSSYFNMLIYVCSTSLMLLFSTAKGRPVTMSLFWWRDRNEYNSVFYRVWKQTVTLFIGIYLKRHKT